MNDARIRIRRGFARPEPELVKAFAGTATGPVVDAMGRRGGLAHSIRPLTTAKRFAGTALPVWTVPRDNLVPYAALRFAEPGDVLVIATGEDESSVLGDIAIGMAKNAGIAAVVTNGLVRDIEGIEAVGIPVFARALSPNSPQKNGPGEIGFTVAIGGVSVTAGDIVIGDADGVVVVPREAAATTLGRLAKVMEKERAMEAAVAAGAASPDWLDGVLDGPDVEVVD